MDLCFLRGVGSGEQKALFVGVIGRGCRLWWPGSNDGVGAFEIFVKKVMQEGCGGP